MERFSRQEVQQTMEKEGIAGDADRHLLQMDRIADGISHLPAQLAAFVVSKIAAHFTIDAQFVGLVMEGLPADKQAEIEGAVSDWLEGRQADTIEKEREG